MSKKKKPTRKPVSKKPAKTPVTKKVTKSRKPKSKTTTVEKTEVVQQPVQNDSVVNFWKDFESQLEQPVDNYKSMYSNEKKFPTNYSNVDFNGHFKPLCLLPTKNGNQFFKKVDKKMTHLIDDALMYSFDHPLVTSIVVICISSIVLFGGMILWNKFH